MAVDQARFTFSPYIILHNRHNITVGISRLCSNVNTHHSQCFSAHRAQQLNFNVICLFHLYWYMVDGDYVIYDQHSDFIWCISHGWRGPSYLASWCQQSIFCWSLITGCDIHIFYTLDGTLMNTFVCNRNIIKIIPLQINNRNFCFAITLNDLTGSNWISISIDSFLVLNFTCIHHVNGDLSCS